MRSLPIIAVFISVLATPPNALCDNNAKELPPGEHRELVKIHCTGCHSAKLVAQNRLSREGWDKLITWMQKKQGLWILGPDMRSKVLDYLEENFSPSTRSIESFPWGERKLLSKK